MRQLIERAPVLARLRPEDRDRIAAAARNRTYAKGSVIAAAGELWPYVLLVAQGFVRTVKTSEKGRVLAAVTLGPGEVFFGQTLFDGQPLPASLEAESRCRVYLWDGSLLLQPIKKDPASLWELTSMLVGRMRRAADVIESLAFHPLPRRLARLLLERFGDAPEGAPRSLTLDEMAARIGSTREVVCRLLYRFADEGLITISRTEISLDDRGRLEALATQAPD